MLIDTEKEHGRPLVRKSEYDSPAIGKSQLLLKAVLSSLLKECEHLHPGSNITNQKDATQSRILVE